MSDEPFTPQQRLAVSRRALLEQLQGGPGRAAAQPARRDPFAWGALARQLAQRWWRRHPANAVGQVVRPWLERHAREQPAKLMAAAATAGALVMLVRPWRLLSATAVVAALLKTSDVADLVTTLMQKTAPPRKDE